MRILHTADWHLGHTLHDVDRGPEHVAFLGWLVEVLASEGIDTLLIAGDIFDAGNPPSAALQLWHRFLVDAWRRLPELHIVAIAGNHDSPSRLEASAPLLDAMGRLHVVGSAAPERMVAKVPGAIIAAVPFLRPMDLPVGLELAEAVRVRYAETVAAARLAQGPGDALLAMGHCYMVAGQVSERSERKIQVGYQLALPVDIFATDLDYVALGHLHLAQAVGGRADVRYAGSPLPLAMDERRYRHSVEIAEFTSGRLTARRALPVPRRRPLRRIPESGAASLAEVTAALAAMPAAVEGDDASLWPLVEVCVAIDRYDPATRAQVQAAGVGRAMRLVRVAVDAGRQPIPLSESLGGAVHDLPRLEDLAPRDVFVRSWSADRGTPTPALLAAFDDLVTMAADPEASARAREVRDRVAPPRSTAKARGAA